MAQVALKDVSVHFPVNLGGHQRSLFAAAANRASFGRIATNARQAQIIEALRGVSFDLKDGDRLAVIGRNGAGKSTLLKLLAGMLLPQGGAVNVDGEISAILSLGSGLDPDRTGRENATFLARLLALPRPSIPALLEDVIEFTELGSYFDMPMRIYSAGMWVRLIFAVVTYLPRDILLVDEVIGAGDAFFVRKAKQRAQERFAQSKILVVTSHAPEILFELCNKAIRLERGELIDSGAPAEVWDRYMAST